MMYIGIDFHKKYSIASAVDEQGTLVKESRIEGNTAIGFKRFIESLNKPCKVVLEACWNWGDTYSIFWKA